MIAKNSPPQIPGNNRLAFSGRIFAAVLFDLDGTLINSAAAVRRSWIRWAQEQRIAPEQLQNWHGVPAADIVRALVPGPGWEAALARVHELELLDVRGVQPLPGAVDALQRLAAGRMALVTSCTAQLAAARLGAAGLAMPDTVITADDVSRGKPDPQPFVLGAAKLGVDPRECLVIEDAPSGLAAGRAAGATTVGVVGTVSGSELQADLVVQSLTELGWQLTDHGVQLLAAQG